MHYHNITKDDMKNGDGLRVVLWVAGCAHHCEDCHNSITWDPNGGIEFDNAAERELLEILGRPYISGVTFSGGDPLFPGNREEIGRLVRLIDEKFPTKTKWLYTGYLWEEIQDLDFLDLLDVVVDGRFEKEKSDQTLHWKGSSNQRVIDVKKSLKQNETVLHA
mgnify:CR=1 FL=1